MKTDGKKFSILVDQQHQNDNQDGCQVRKPLQLMHTNHTNVTSTSATIFQKKLPLKEQSTKHSRSLDDKHTQTSNVTTAKVDKGIQLKWNEISANDLTSKDPPSEKYWEILAENRRLALENALKENEILHKRLELLEQQCKLKDDMLQEAQTMAEVLKEMLDDIDE